MSDINWNLICALKTIPHVEAVLHQSNKEPHLVVFLAMDSEESRRRVRELAPHAEISLDEPDFMRD